MTRRHALTAALAAGAVTTFPGGALALSASQATSLVNSVVADINAIISSGGSESAMIRQFEGIFDRYADVPTIARYALGSDARRATQAQMTAFTAAFRGYVARKYGKRFREFIGGVIEVRQASSLPRGIQVETRAVLRGQAPFRVDFHVSDASGRAKFYNIIIEGIDMLLTERTEIGALLDRRRGDIDRMTADLQRAG